MKKGKKKLREKRVKIKKKRKQRTEKRKKRQKLFKKKFLKKRSQFFKFLTGGMVLFPFFLNFLYYSIES